MKMSILERSKDIPGLVVFKHDSYYDYRGENVQTYDKAEFDKLISPIQSIGTPLNFITDSISFSTKHVLRGFHGDTKSWKLIQCLRGTIFFAVIDLRNSSNEVFTTTLTDKNRISVLVPNECVNAHLCMSDDCIFSYKLSHGYVDVKDQLHVKWNNINYPIRWPIKTPITSDRDA